MFNTREEMHLKKKNFIYVQNVSLIHVYTRKYSKNRPIQIHHFGGLVRDVGEHPGETIWLERVT